MDIGLNDSFDIELDQRNDLPTVSARTEFEQRLALSLTRYFGAVIGSTDRAGTLTLLETQARRVAQDFDQLDSLSQITATLDPETPNTVLLTVIYDTGEDFTFNISE